MNTTNRLSGQSIPLRRLYVKNIESLPVTVGKIEFYDAL